MCSAFIDCLIMKDQVTIFENAQFGQIRTQGTSNEPWFCLADVCKVLELSNPRMVKKQLNPRWVITNYVSTPIISHGVNTGKTKRVALTFINEPNLYRCIFQSRKKEAEQFQDWVFEEVLPAIRAKGQYQLQEAHRKELEVARQEERRLRESVKTLIEDRDTLKNQLSIKELGLTKQYAEIVALENELKKKVAKEVHDKWNKPAEPAPSHDGDSLFGKAMKASAYSCTVSQLAKVLRSNGVDTGERRLLNWLRMNGYLCKAGADRNFPTQKAMDKGFFEVKGVEVEDTAGHKRYQLMTFVTATGQSHVINKFLSATL